MTLPNPIGSGPRVQGTAPNTPPQGQLPTGRLAQFKLAVGNFISKLVPSQGDNPSSNGTSLHAHDLKLGPPGLPLAALDHPDKGQLPDLGTELNYHENPDPYKAHGTEYQQLPPSLRNNPPMSEYGRVPLNELKQDESPYGKAPLNELEQPVSEYANRPTELDPPPVNEYANSPFGVNGPYGRLPSKLPETPPSDETKQ